MSKKALAFASSINEAIGAVVFKDTEAEKRPAGYKSIEEAKAAYEAAASALQTGAVGMYGFYPRAGRMLNDFAVKAKCDKRWFDVRANSKNADIPVSILKFRDEMKPLFARYCPSNPDRPWEYIRSYARRDAELAGLFGMVKPEATPAAAKTEAAAPAAAKTEAAAPAAAEEEVTQETLKKKTLEDIERALKRLQKAQAAWKTEDVRKAEKGLTSAFNALTGGGIG
jgi:hypothetical protein